VRFASYGSLQVVSRATNGQVGSGVADDRQIVKVAMCVTGFTLSGGTEQRGDLRMALNVGLVCEVQITTVGLAFAGEGVLQVLVGFRALEIRHDDLLLFNF
jgi:hypothetical protein